MNRSGLLPIETTVQCQFEACFSDVDSISFVIGVSGGPDSMALLHILNKLGVRLYVAHVNYRKRELDSDKDAELVKQTAHDLGINCEVVLATAEEAVEQNFQKWARDVRYRLFEKKASEVDASGIVTAHHQDDQIETILQKIFRGTGMAGWSAMEVWDGRLFRPFLGVKKTEIIAYCEEQSIDFRIDSSNLESGFARNFLRNEWLAGLERYFPGWRKNVLRVNEQALIFETAIKHILDRILNDDSCLKRDEFLGLEKGLQKSVLIYYLHYLNHGTEISRGTLNELHKLKDIQTGRSFRLNDRLTLFRDRNCLKVIEVTPKKHRVRHTLHKEDVIGTGVVFEGFQFRAELFHSPDFSQILYLNWDAIEWPLKLRSWEKGDRFQPFGMKGHQSVADHLANRKIRASLKADAVVVESPNGIIYAVLFPVEESRRPPGTIAESAKCHASTNSCLTINFIS